MDVFVYGTLTDPERVREILSAFEFRGPATIDGLHRVEGVYPTLAPGGRVTGRVLRTTEVEALDAYEGVESGLYVRVAVPLADTDTESGLDADDSVEAYVGDPDPLDTDAEWPGDGPFGERVRRFLRENEVVVRRA